MSKQTKKEIQRYELIQKAAGAAEAELDLELHKMRVQRARREHAMVYDYDTEARGVFHFYGQVTDSACFNFGEKVTRYCHLNPGAPVTIWIQSPGGSVLPGLGLYDVLRTVSAQGHHITCGIRGYAASFGAILLQAGDTRLMGYEAVLMLHEISSGAFGKLHEMEDEIKFCKMLNLRLFTILADRTDEKWTAPKLYAKARATDWWLSADESIREGFCDAVG